VFHVGGGEGNEIGKRRQWGPLEGERKGGKNFAKIRSRVRPWGKHCEHHRGNRQHPCYVGKGKKWGEKKETGQPRSKKADLPSADLSLRQSKKVKPRKGGSILQGRSTTGYLNKGRGATTMTVPWCGRQQLLLHHRRKI